MHGTYGQATDDLKLTAFPRTDDIPTISALAANRMPAEDAHA